MPWETWRPAWSVERRSRQAPTLLGSLLGRRRHREPLATLGAPALQHEPTVLRGHPHEKTVRAAAATAIRLERTLHDRGSPATAKTLTRNEDSNRLLGSMSIESRASAAFVPPPGVWYIRVPAISRRGSPRSFPQLWKRLWKTNGFPAGKSISGLFLAGFRLSEGRRGRRRATLRAFTPYAAGNCWGSRGESGRGTDFSAETVT